MAYVLHPSGTEGPAAAEFASSLLQEAMSGVAVNSPLKKSVISWMPQQTAFFVVVHCGFLFGLLLLNKVLLVSVG